MLIARLLSFWSLMHGSHFLEDLTLIMERVFLQKIEDSAPLETLFEEYIDSPAFKFIRREVVTIDWHLARESDRTTMFVWRSKQQVNNILDRCREQCPIGFQT